MNMTDFKLNLKKQREGERMKRFLRFLFKGKDFRFEWTNDSTSYTDGESIFIKYDMQTPDRRTFSDEELNLLKKAHSIHERGHLEFDYLPAYREWIKEHSATTKQELTNPNGKKIFPHLAQFFANASVDGRMENLVVIHHPHVKPLVDFANKEWRFTERKVPDYTGMSDEEKEAAIKRAWVNDFFNGYLRLVLDLELPNDIHQEPKDLLASVQDEIDRLRFTATTAECLSVASEILAKTWSTLLEWLNTDDFEDAKNDFDENSGVDQEQTSHSNSSWNTDEEEAQSNAKTILISVKKPSPATNQEEDTNSSPEDNSKDEGNNSSDSNSDDEETNDNSSETGANEEDTDTSDSSSDDEGNDSSSSNGTDEEDNDNSSDNDSEGEGNDSSSDDDSDDTSSENGANSESTNSSEKTLEDWLAEAKSEENKISNDVSKECSEVDASNEVIHLPAELFEQGCGEQSRTINIKPLEHIATYDQYSSIYQSVRRDANAMSVLFKKLLEEKRGTMLKNQSRGKFKAGKAWKVTKCDNPNVFETKIKGVPGGDLYVDIIADVSGSTYELVDSSSKVIDQIKKGLISFLEALHTAKIPCLANAYTTDDYSESLIIPIKPSENAYTMLDKQTLASLEPAYGNKDVEVLYWALERTKKRPENTKIQIVITDGIPNFKYKEGPDSISKLVEIAEKDNIDIICVYAGNQSSSVELLKEMYGEKRLIISQTQIARELKKHVTRILRKKDN